MSNPIRRSLISTILAILVSVVVLWWLLGDLKAEELWHALREAKLWPLLLGAVIAIGIQVIRAWRFALLASGKPALPSWSMIGIASQLVLMNFLLPFKLGELSFPLMMKRAYGTPFGEGAGILVLCRLLDFGIVAGMILFGTAFLLDPKILGLNPIIIGLLGLIAVVGPIFLIDGLGLLERIGSPTSRLRKTIGQMTLGAERMRPPGRRLLSAIMTVSIWLAHAAIAYLTAIAVSADLGFPSIAMASAASNLAFALPISGVAGLGPPQAAWATMLHLQDIDWTVAITTALICHGVLLVTLSIWGLLTWIGQMALMTTKDVERSGDEKNPGSRPLRTNI